MSLQIATGNCIIGISPLLTIVVALIACGGLNTTQAMTKQKYHYSDNVSWPIDFQVYFQRITRSRILHHGVTYAARIVESFLQGLFTCQSSRTFYMSIKVHKDLPFMNFDLHINRGLHS